MSPKTLEILLNTSFAKEKAGCRLSILADKHTRPECDILGMFLSYLFLCLASMLFCFALLMCPAIKSTPGFGACESSNATLRRQGGDKGS